MTNKVPYFRIKNFERFQHYKNRRPAWIKLYASILSDWKFNSLTEIQQNHLVKIWILASQNYNMLPFDPTIIRKQAGLNSRVVLDVFIDAGFIEIASKPDRDCIEFASKPDRVDIETEETKGVMQKIASIPLVPNKEVEKEKHKNPVTKKPATSNYEIQDSTKAERAWLDEYERVLGLKPDRSPAKDRKIMKDLVNQHGLKTVLERIPRHIAGRALLSIGGFKTKFNDLIDRAGNPNAMKLTRPPELARDELHSKIQEQVLFVQEELEEGVEWDIRLFNMAIGHYVTAYEDRFDHDPLTNNDREWFHRQLEEFQELESADYAASREEEATGMGRL